MLLYCTLLFYKYIHGVGIVYESNSPLCTKRKRVIKPQILCRRFYSNISHTLEETKRNKFISFKIKGTCENYIQEFQKNFFSYLHAPSTDILLIFLYLYLGATFSALKSKSKILGHMTYLRNWEKLSVYFSRFDGWNVQSYQKKPFGTWQFGKNGILVNLIAKKMEK